MTPTDFTQIVAKPNAINDGQTAALEKIVDEFPFFQAARALRLKGLYNENSFRYNYALKVTAAYTTDRSILFDFITSDEFTSVQKELFDQKMAELNDISVTFTEIDEEIQTKASPLKQSILASIHESKPEDEVQVEVLAYNDIAEIENSSASKPSAVQQVELEEKIDIGKPLEFERSEKHSFEEWLKLASHAPIQREIANKEVVEIVAETDFERQKQSETIDRFIQTNPKIQPVKSEQSVPIVQQASEEDHSYLMTETLARVYLEQKKYSKAIQAYQILILKYPEKSSFFADRILDIKYLQQNNNIK